MRKQYDIWKLKNTTLTQYKYNCNAAVGFFMALLIREFYPSAIKTDWEWYGILWAW